MKPLEFSAQDRCRLPVASIAITKGEERFEITAGRVRMRPGKTSILEVGETVVVPPGEGHV